MPGTNAGTGHPITFRCVMCRKRRGYSTALEAKSDVGTHLEATGFTRRVYKSRGRLIGPRQTNRQIQYRCLTCGHVGWTQHIDGERLLKRWLDRQEARP